MQACVSYLSAMILLFLDPQFLLAMTSPQGVLMLGRDLPTTAYSILKTFAQLFRPNTRE